MRFVTDDVSDIKPYDGGLQVIVAGLPRCATSSLQVALEEIGYAPCMHMAHVAPFTSRLKLCLAAALEKDKIKRQAILHQLFDGYAATADFPGMTFVDDLMEMYPDAKIILNKRQNVEAWQRSITDTISFYATRKYWAACYLWPTDYLHYKVQKAVQDYQARGRYGENDIFRLEIYEKHNQWVRDIAKKNGKEVLEWQPADSWAPICGFLDKKVPDTPFPRLNDKKFMQKLKAFLVIRGLTSWTVVLGAPVVAWYYYMKWLS